MTDVEIPTEEILESGDQQDRKIGLFIAIVAVFLTINSALGNKADNDEIINRVNASNSWAYFQAKRIRSHQIELTRDLTLLMGKTSLSAQADAMKLASKYDEGVEKYKKEADEITEQAKSQEKAADQAEKKGNLFDFGEVLFQITLVLCSVAIITKQKLFFRMGQAFAAAGGVALLYALFSY